MAMTAAMDPPTTPTRKVARSPCTNCAYTSWPKVVVPIQYVPSGAAACGPSYSLGLPLSSSIGPTTPIASRIRTRVTPMISLGLRTA